MSEVFSFDFETDEIGDDIDHGMDVDASAMAREEHLSGFLQPELRMLDDMLSTFPSRLAYTTISLKAQEGVSFDLPRRELYDIRAQLMAEDTQAVVNDTPIPGLSNDDITPNVYEGGFKTWECAVDLANYLISQNFEFAKDGGRDVQIVELGAGTALPSLALLRQWRSTSSLTERSPTLHIFLADYNRSVLELATIPNLFLTWNCNAATKSGECDVSPKMLLDFLRDLERHKVTVYAVVGSWSPSFHSLISRRLSTVCPVDTLILASETIYSPISIRMFTATLLDLLSNASARGGTARALVAAKRVYFGVGGGVDEFLRVLEHMGGIGKVVWESEGAGVGRVILEVERPEIKNECWKT